MLLVQIVVLTPAVNKTNGRFYFEKPTVHYTDWLIPAYNQTSNTLLKHVCVYAANLGPQTCRIKTELPFNSTRFTFARHTLPSAIFKAFSINFSGVKQLSRSH